MNMVVVLLAVLSLCAGVCGGAPTATPTRTPIVSPTPTSTPTLTPRPTPALSNQKDYNTYIEGSRSTWIVHQEVYFSYLVLSPYILDMVGRIPTPPWMMVNIIDTSPYELWALGPIGGGLLAPVIMSSPCMIVAYYSVDPVALYQGVDIAMPWAGFFNPSTQSVSSLAFSAFGMSGNIGFLDTKTTFMSLSDSSAGSSSSPPPPGDPTYTPTVNPTPTGTPRFIAATTNQLGMLAIGSHYYPLKRIAVSDRLDIVGIHPGFDGISFGDGGSIMSLLGGGTCACPHCRGGAVDFAYHPIDAPDLAITPLPGATATPLPEWGVFVEGVPIEGVHGPADVAVQPISYIVWPPVGQVVWSSQNPQIDYMLFYREETNAVNAGIGGQLLPLGVDSVWVQDNARHRELLINDVTKVLPSADSNLFIRFISGLSHPNEVQTVDETQSSGELLTGGDDKIGPGDIYVKVKNTLVSGAYTTQLAEVKFTIHNTPYQKSSTPATHKLETRVYLDKKVNYDDPPNYVEIASGKDYTIKDGENKELVCKFKNPPLLQGGGNTVKVEISPEAGYEPDVVKGNNSAQAEFFAAKEEIFQYLEPGYTNSPLCTQWNPRAVMGMNWSGTRGVDGPGRVTVKCAFSQEDSHAATPAPAPAEATFVFTKGQNFSTYTPSSGNAKDRLVGVVRYPEIIYEGEWYATGKNGSEYFPQGGPRPRFYHGRVYWQDNSPFNAKDNVPLKNVQKEDSKGKKYDTVVVRLYEEKIFPFSDKVVAEGKPDKDGFYTLKLKDLSVPGKKVTGKLCVEVGPVDDEPPAPDFVGPPAPSVCKRPNPCPENSGWNGRRITPKGPVVFHYDYYDYKPKKADRTAISISTLCPGDGDGIYNIEVRQPVIMLHGVLGSMNNEFLFGLINMKIKDDDWRRIDNLYDTDRIAWAGIHGLSNPYANQYAYLADPTPLETGSYVDSYPDGAGNKIEGRMYKHYYDGFNLFKVLYDSRFSNEITARKELTERVRWARGIPQLVSGKAMEACKRNGWDPAPTLDKPRVSIIAHSMGGLVTRCYIEKVDKGEDVEKFIMLDTPLEGAAKCYPLMTNCMLNDFIGDYLYSNFGGTSYAGYKKAWEKAWARKEKNAKLPPEEQKELTGEMEEALKWPSTFKVSDKTSADKNSFMEYEEYALNFLDGGRQLMPTTPGWAVEVWPAGKDPAGWDPDEDGDSKDSDGDGYCDGQEVRDGTDRLNAASHPVGTKESFKKWVDEDPVDGVDNDGDGRVDEDGPGGGAGTMYAIPGPARPEPWKDQKKWKKHPTLAANEGGGDWGDNARLYNKWLADMNANIKARNDLVYGSQKNLTMDPPKTEIWQTQALQRSYDPVGKTYSNLNGAMHQWMVVEPRWAQSSKPALPNGFLDWDADNKHWTIKIKGANYLWPEGRWLDDLNKQIKRDSIVVEPDPFGGAPRRYVDHSRRPPYFDNPDASHPWWKWEGIDDNGNGKPNSNLIWGPGNETVPKESSDFDAEGQWGHVVWGCNGIGHTPIIDDKHTLYFSVLYLSNTFVKPSEFPQEDYEWLDFADVDGDYLPDSWELKYFGNLAQNGFGDPDRDGVDNLREWWHGTNPMSWADR